VTRVLRKYGKVLLAVLGSLLMIVFVLPNFNSGSGRGTSVVGRIDGKKITSDDLGEAQSDLAILRSFGAERATESLDERDRNLHWYLLLRDAGRYGFTSITVAPEQLDQDLMQAGMTAADINRHITDLGVSHREVESAFSHLQAIGRYTEFVSNNPRPVSSIELVGDRMLAKAQVAYATIDGAAGWENSPAPTEDQIKKQFDLYKGVVRTMPTSGSQEIPPLPPEINGHHFPFGYKYPDRVAVEWLEFSKDAMKTMMKPGRQDYEDAYKYYREHPSEFHNTTAPAVVLSTQPTTRPFSEVQEELVGRQVDQRIERQLSRIYDRARSAASDPWRNQTVDSRGFRDTLKPEQWVDYKKLADDLAKNRDFEGFKPEYHSTTGLLDQEGLGKLPGIGKAVYQSANQGPGYSFEQLATAVHELVELPPKDPMARLFLQVGTEGPLLQDPAGNLYMYRVKGVEKSHDPASLEEVRQQVIDDLKKESAFERGEKEAADLASAAKNTDLMTLAEQRKIPVQKSPEITRIEQELPEDLRRIRNFVETSFSLIHEDAASRPATQASTQPTTLPVGERSSTTLANDDSLKVYVLQLLNASPARPADFAMELSRERMLMQMYGPNAASLGGYFTLLQPPPAEQAALTGKYFTLEALSDRLHFKPETPFAKKQS
jgi:hypothetical protein